MIDPGFTTPAMAEVFSADQRVYLFMYVEAALASAQAELGLIPQSAADEITVATVEHHPNPEGLLLDGWDAGTPILPLLDYLRNLLPEDARPWLHYCATTQDIVDTATLLQMQSTVAILHTQALGIGLALVDAIRDFGDAAMMTRSLLQPAEPSLFCLRAAHWLAPFASAMNQLFHLQYPVQLGGPIGDQLDIDVALTVKFAEHLGFVPVHLAWHTNRAPLIAIVEQFHRLVRAAAKIASDLVFMAQSGEATMRSGGSTAMPHKRNPIDAIRCLAAAAAFDGAASIVTSAKPHELERSAGSWHAEWFAIPLIAQTASAALESLGRALANLTIVRADIDVPDNRREAARRVADLAVRNFDDRDFDEL
jgi:3-carboxy-cis,cis-muconate cycloisomerase